MPAVFCCCIYRRHLSRFEMLRYQLVAGERLRSARTGGTCFRAKKISVTAAKGAMHVPRYWWLSDCETRTRTVVLFCKSVTDAVSPCKVTSVEMWLCTLSCKGLDWRPILTSFLSCIARKLLYLSVMVLRPLGCRFSSDVSSVVLAKGLLCTTVCFTDVYSQVCVSCGNNWCGID